MRSLIIIPARKNSKRIKNKNIVKVNRKPLIYWTINYAKKFKKNFDLVVSSDCNKIKKLCYDENILYLKRSKNTSGDYSSIHKVIFNTLKKINKQYKYIVLLQPTSPFRNLNLINKALKILNRKKNFDSLVHLAFDNSFTGTLKNNIWKPHYNLNKRSQDIDNKFVPTGGLYFYRSHLYKNKIKLPKKIYGLITKDETWIDIDNESDLAILDFYLKNPKNRRLLVLNK